MRWFRLKLKAGSAQRYVSDKWQVSKGEEWKLVIIDAAIAKRATYHRGSATPMATPTAASMT
jgi:hypothetical protein